MWILDLHVRRGALITPRRAAAIRIEAGQCNHRDAIHAWVTHFIRRLGENITGREHLEMEYADHGRPTVFLVGIELVNEAIQVVLKVPAA